MAPRALLREKFRPVIAKTGLPIEVGCTKDDTVIMEDYLTYRRSTCMFKFNL